MDLTAWDSHDVWGRAMMYNHYELGPFWIVAIAIAVVPFWRICKRVGHSPWLSLLIAVPLLNILFIYFLAFSQWPSLKGLEDQP
jgi:hypothetical protein